jgi:hypothetical protein
MVVHRKAPVARELPLVAPCFGFPMDETGGCSRQLFRCFSILFLGFVEDPRESQGLQNAKSHEITVVPGSRQPWVTGGGAAPKNTLLYKQRFLGADRPAGPAGSEAH